MSWCRLLHFWQFCHAELSAVPYKSNVHVHVNIIKATPIYLLVLHAQEVGNEPFWNKKKKLKNVTFLLFLFILESDD